MTDRIGWKLLMATSNQGDLALVKSVLDAHDIVHMVEGEFFMQVRPLVEPAKIMVRADQFPQARELLKDFKSGTFGSDV